MIPASYLVRWHDSSPIKESGERQFPGLEGLPKGLTGTAVAFAAWLVLIASV